jgi:hypothetical protein
MIHELAYRGQLKEGEQKMIKLTKIVNCFKLPLVQKNTVLFTKINVLIFNGLQ